MLFGSDGMQIRQLYMQDKCLSTLGGGQEAMKNLIELLDRTPKTTLGEYAYPFAKKANLLAYVDLPKLAAQVIKSISESQVVPFPVNRQMIDNLTLEPSYIGFSLSTGAQELTMQTRIPVEQLQGMARLSVLVSAAVRPPL
jgi:hypothetical protein